MNKNSIITVLIIIILAILAYIAFGPKKIASNPMGNVPYVSNTETNQAPSSGTNITPDANVVKTNWGVSFTKASNWDVTTTTANKITLSEVSGKWAGDIMTIEYVSGNSITDTDAKFGDVTYFYDGTTGTWMRTVSELGTTQAAMPVSTVNGFPVFDGTGRWKTLIIPLSHTTFLKANIGGSGESQPLYDLVATLTVPQ